MHCNSLKAQHSRTRHQHKQARGWVSELCAGVDDDGYACSSATYLFTVSLTLTEAGLVAPPGLGLGPVGLLFAYLRLLCDAGAQLQCLVSHQVTSFPLTLLLSQVLSVYHTSYPIFHETRSTLQWHMHAHMSTHQL